MSDSFKKWAEIQEKLTGMHKDGLPRAEELKKLLDELEIEKKTAEVERRVKHPRRSKKFLEDRKGI